MDDAERQCIEEFDYLFQLRSGYDRLHMLRRAMMGMRTHLWVQAQPAERGGDGRGWDCEDRWNRYMSLLRRTR